MVGLQNRVDYRAGIKEMNKQHGGKDKWQRKQSKDRSNDTREKNRERQEERGRELKKEKKTVGWIEFLKQMSTNKTLTTHPDCLRKLFI